MFQGLIKRAENAVDSVVSRFVGRAAAAVPLVIAGGFATAALTVWLVEQYGAITAYGMMAALFAVIGLIAMAVVTNGAEIAEAVSEATGEPSAGDASNEAEGSGEGIDPMDLLTPEVRSFLSSAAPMALPAVARGVTRNLPLIFLLALVAFVISRFAETGAAATAEAEAEPAAPPATPAPAPAAA